MSNHRFGYGYPPYVSNAWEASTIDAVNASRDMWAKTAAHNQAYVDGLAASAAADTQVYYDPPPSTLSGTGHEPWKPYTGYGVDAESRHAASSPESGSFTRSAPRGGGGTLAAIAFLIFAVGGAVLWIM